MTGDLDIEIAGEADRLLTAARGLMARGEDKFTVAAVCAEAGLGREAFRRHFSGREALVAALSRPAAPAEMPATDQWLERRLRVFERALSALEARAEETARAQALTIARLEERLTAAAMEVPSAPPPPPLRAPDPPPPKTLAPLPAPLPPPVTPPPRADMAETLEQARRAARKAAHAPPRRKRRRRPPVLLRWLAFTGLMMVAALLCVALLLGDPARATQAAGAMRHREAPSTAIARLKALADYGDPGAQVALAFAYLRGQGVPQDAGAAARWSAAAAARGGAVAKALAGTLALGGPHPDPAQAASWLAAAAADGNVKAMHNLGIVYARGTGLRADPAAAAAWFARAAAYGYVDSAFDLAVLYERGTGVAQSLPEALTWYEIAARAGDGPAAERAAALRGQLDPEEAARALAAAARFTPRIPPADANQPPPL